MANKVREIMTGTPHFVPPEADLVSVARTMRDEDIGCVLVGDRTNMYGMVTDRDLVVRGLAGGLNPNEAKVGGICSDATVMVGPEDDLDEAVRLMRDHAVRRLPVVEEGRPIGIISIGDLAIEKDPTSALADISKAKANR
jgi:CBS domain-containing protein